ncbi:MAG: hypothetical protein ABIK65_12845 [Candidatus Eisenbacteria bacterium]
MRKLVFLTAMVAMITSTAFAAHPAGSLALGWVDWKAPIGVRYQIAEKIAGDIGFGFASYDGGNTEIRVHVGLPIELIGHDRCSLDFRPGVSVDYTSPENENVDSWMDLVLHGWLAFNLMITDNLGLNAAHGVDIEINGEQKAGDVVLAESTTDFMTTSSDVTNLGLFFWF